MIMAPRILWLIVLACFVCGCGSMRPARLPAAPAGSGAEDTGLSVVETGDYVTVVRSDGTRRTGRVRAITDDSVTVEVDRGLGVQPRLDRQAIPRAEITAVSKEQTNVGRTLLLVGGLVVGTAAVAAADMAANGYEWESGN